MFPRRHGLCRAWQVEERLVVFTQLAFFRFFPRVTQLQVSSVKKRVRLTGSGNLKRGQVRDGMEIFPTPAPVGVCGWTISGVLS